MKFALYHAWINKMGGCERTIFEYTKRSRHDWTVFTSVYDPQKTYEPYRKGEVNVKNLTGLKAADGFVKRALKVVPSLFQKHKELDNFDLVLISTGGVGELLALRNHSRPLAVFCHTPLRVAHNMRDFYLNGKPLLKRIILSTAIEFYKIFERLAWKRFNLITCNSKNVRQRIINAGLAQDAIVMYHGIDIKKSKLSDTREKFFLCTGRIKPYKRFELAIEAFKLFSQSHPDFRLVIAGYPDDEKYLTHLKSISTDKVDFVVKPSDDEMFKLYERCFATVFTAKDEDMGIVPVEGFAFGKACISVNSGGPKEYVINGKTGFLVEETPSAISSGMEQLLKSNLDKMKVECRELAQEFDWDVFTKRMDDLLETTALSQRRVNT